MFSTYLIPRQVKMSFIIEVRPVLEKYKLKQITREFTSRLRLRVHKVPHVTLVYNFWPKGSPFKVIETVKKVADNYDNLEYYYDGYEVKHGNKGYVIAIRIRPSPELVQFREEVYGKLKGHITERPDVRQYNENLWFHAAVSFNLGPEQVKKFLSDTELVQKLQRFLFHARVLRITLVRKGRIVYEYDTLTKRILDRSHALSSDELENTYKKYREKFLKIEVDRRNWENVWFVADTHFGHKNIIKYAARPFVDTATMDECMKSKWNEVVSSNDIVYIVGDFARRNLKDYVIPLKGKKVFIQGNHDPPGIGVDRVYMKFGNFKFILTHYPVEVNAENDEWVIHGHMHNNKLREYPFINSKARTINVGVDLTSFYPVNLRWLLDLMVTENDYLYLPTKI